MVSRVEFVLGQFSLSVLAVQNGMQVERDELPDQNSDKQDCLGEVMPVAVKEEKLEEANAKHRECGWDDSAQYDQA